MRRWCPLRFAVLGVLREYDEKDDSRRFPAQIARALVARKLEGIHNSSVARVLKDLERDGLVTCTIATRGQLVMKPYKITNQGKAVLLGLCQEIERNTTDGRQSAGNERRRLRTGT